MSSTAKTLSKKFALIAAKFVLSVFKDCLNQISTLLILFVLMAPLLRTPTTTFIKAAE